MKKFTFYTEDDNVPRYWFLIECIWWVAVQRIPFPESYRARSIDHFGNDENPPRGPILSETTILALEPEYTELLNISPCPMKVADDNSDLPVLREALKELQNLNQEYPSWNLSSFHQERIQALEDQIADQVRWLKEHRAALDEPVTKLLDALKAGRIKAYGRKIVGASIEAAERNQRLNSLVLDRIESKLIPASEWNLANADWDNCALQTEHHLYAAIEIHNNSLLTEFPPECEKISDGGHCDGLVITSADHKFEFADETQNSSRSGRPSKNWDAFYLELMRRFIDGNLPSKQSAAVYELRIWFQDELGEEVGLSTIAEKLSPFYNEFVSR